MRDLIDPKIEASVETALLALALRAYDEDPLRRINRASRPRLGREIIDTPRGYRSGALTQQSYGLGRGQLRNRKLRRIT